MRIARHRQIQQRLQNSLHMRRREQVVAARDQRHTLKRVVDDDRKMIRRRHLLARQHDVAEQPRIDGDGAMLALGPAPCSSNVNMPACNAAFCASSRNAKGAPDEIRALRSLAESARHVPG